MRGPRAAGAANSIGQLRVSVDASAMRETRITLRSGYVCSMPLCKACLGFNIWAGYIQVASATEAEGILAAGLLAHLMR